MSPLPGVVADRVVSYIRTSSAEQGKAFGPGHQRAEIKRFCAAQGLTVAVEHHEDISGTTLAAERPGLQAAIVSCYQHGARTIILSERTRLARKEHAAYDVLHALEQAGISVLYADGSNARDESGLLLDGMGHVIAAHERRKIVARLAGGRAVKEARHPKHRAQGGGLPHGYVRTDDGLVGVDPVAADEVRRVFALVRDGATVRAAAAAMAEATGRPWSVARVGRIVRCEMYKQVEPARIVDPRVWNAAGVALDRRRRRPAA